MSKNDFVLMLQILNEIAQHKIKIYEFPEAEEEEENKLHKVLRDRVPFAVVGANTVVDHNGKKVRGRKYPWGVAEGISSPAAFYLPIIVSLRFIFHIP